MPQRKKELVPRVHPTEKGRRTRRITSPGPTGSPLDSAPFPNLSLLLGSIAIGVPRGVALEDGPLLSGYASVCVFLRFMQAPGFHRLESLDLGQRGGYVIDEKRYPQPA
jgi:hypothetical protein